MRGTAGRVRGRTRGGEAPGHVAHAHIMDTFAGGRLLTDRGPERKGVRRPGNGLTKNASTRWNEKGIYFLMAMQMT